MPMRILCLHGWGTNVKILQTQIGPLMRELERDHSANFHFIEGNIDAEPGPGVEGFYDGPYYSYYKFPRSFEDSEESMLEAYEMLYDVIDEDGPFDGALGFSHGGTLISGFLIHHAKTRPYDPPPFRCAIFLNSLPPFRMHPGGKPHIDDGLDGYLNIHTVSIVGKKDFVYEYSLALHHLCNPSMSSLVMHNNGHDVPRDPANVSVMARAVRKMFTEAVY
ncbi:hypothetical protein Plec18167_001596 [Paecilomyces lecythidis]|uniref:Serine hydrolase domain-containing protein n=1 Tax=Paecilomyces lecythidis TaxID=3004212 RepID=A0ABR3YA32_9EURO